MLLRSQTCDNQCVHPHTNNQADQYNKTITSHSGHYEADHQWDWDIYVQLLTYTYNMEINRSTCTVALKLALKCHLQRPKEFESTTAIKTDAYKTLNPVVLTSPFPCRINIMRTSVDKHIKAAEKSHERGYARCIRTVTSIEPVQIVHLKE